MWVAANAGLTGGEAAASKPMTFLFLIEVHVELKFVLNLKLT